MWVYWFIGLALFNLIALLWQSRRTRKRIAEIQAESDRIRNMDSKIFRLYQEIESMLDNFESYVDEVHEEEESRRKELLEMSRQATTLYMQVMQPAAMVALRPPAPEPSQLEPTPVSPGYDKPEVASKPASKPLVDTKADELRNQVKVGRIVNRDRLELDKLDTKAQKIRYLMGRGFTIDEVARELNIGKGEIKLIVDLDKA